MVTQGPARPITTILGLGVTLEALRRGSLSAERIRRTGRLHRPPGGADQPGGRRDDAPSAETPFPPVELCDRPSVGRSGGCLTNRHLADPSRRGGRQVLAADRLADAPAAGVCAVRPGENALTHGAPPVIVEAWDARDGIDLVVTDAGPACRFAAVPVLSPGLLRHRPTWPGPGRGDGRAGAY